MGQEDCHGKTKEVQRKFKREAVNIIRQLHANVSQTARDIGVSANDLWRWRREADSGGEAFLGSGVASDQELLVLMRELAKVKKE